MKLAEEEKKKTVTSSPGSIPSPNMHPRMGMEKKVIRESNPKKHAAINGKNKEEEDVENNDKFQTIFTRYLIAKFCANF